MKIKNLASAVIGKLTGGTFFPITDGTTTYKVDYNLLAQAILENATRSTLTTTSKTAVGAINETAQAVTANTAGRLGMVRDVNLDDMNTANTCGVYWLNSAVPTVTGTKPTTNGQGLFIVKMQSNVTCKQVYISMTDSEPNVLYRMYDSGAWTAWTQNWITKNLDNKLDLYTGIKIESNTDLNTLTTPGTYFCVNSSTAATLVNSPLSSLGFRLDVSRNGYNTDNYLVQTIQAVVTSTVVIYKRGMSIQGTWGDWYQTDGTPRLFSGITNLSSIPIGSNGCAQFDASVSPTGVTAYFTYWCTGTDDKRSIIAVYTADSTAKAYVNVLHNADGVTWKGWKTITLS